MAVALWMGHLNYLGLCGFICKNESSVLKRWHNFFQLQIVVCVGHKKVIALWKFCG